jgi:vitamin B12/bleomycin/antimicrobial peptide transport system ATP-binding/permease protein
MMKSLANAVGAFAAATLVVGALRPDMYVFFLAAAAIGCAITTSRAAGISIFLRIFVAIFAVETILFGACFLANRLDLWPKAYADLLPPDSLALTVALFGSFIYAISYIPIVRKMTAIADPYFYDAAPTVARAWPLPAVTIAGNRLATATLVFLILVNQAQVAIDVRLSFFSRDFFNAMQNKDQPEFWRQLVVVFVPWASVYVASAVVEYVVTSTFVVRWRRWLSALYIGRWLDAGVHYRMALAGSSVDNPDQRIADDIYGFIYGGGAGTGLYGYSVIALQTVTSLVSFSIVLWGLSANFTVPGTSFYVPGFLFWAALLYAGLGTAIAHWIGRPLVRLYFDRQRYEADFRFGLARLREYSEQIALLGGENAEKTSAMRRFSNVFDNYMRIVHVRKRFAAFTQFYRQISQYIPIVVGAPFFFLGKIQLGVLTQSVRAFGSVEASLTFFVSYYTGLAEFRAVLDRLISFDESIERARALGRATPRVEVDQTARDQVAVAALTLNLPDGRALARIENLMLKAQEPSLLAGVSGSGKSTLFRALAGIWPFGDGRIEAPSAALMLLPQRPYIPIGALRDAIAYPSLATCHGDEELRAALVAAGLPGLTDRLDESDNWQLRLSGGEQQRLAVARALIAKPDWLFLDEATSALDEASEAAVYRAIARELPRTTIVSIGHRATLAAFHTRGLMMNRERGGPSTLAEAAAQLPA